MGRMLSTSAGRFRLFAMAEAVSWAGLLIGMLFKYVLADNEIGVKIFGPIHGFVFLVYILTALLASAAQKWERRTTVLALLASIPPFGTIVFERWAIKTGRLDVQANAA
jgi:integral membrane protein